MGETADTLRPYGADDDYDAASLRAADTDDTTDDPAVTDETLALRADIEQTRTEMSATIDAIQEKLSPQNIVDQAKETVREATVGKVEEMVSNVTDTARDTGNNVIDMIQQNPLPAAMVGLGLGWLLTRGGGGSGGGQQNDDGDRRAYAYSDDQRRYGNQDYAGYQQPVYFRPSNNSNQGGNPISGLIDTVRQNPVPAALAGLGAWMLMNRSGGSSGDRARYENSYRGYQEPGALDQARYRAGRVAEQARDTVGSAAEQARDTAGNVASGVADTAGNVASGIANTAGNVASGVADTAGNVVSGVADTAGNVAGGVADAAGNVVSGVQEGAGALADQAQYRAYQAKSQLQRMLEDSPLVVGLAAAAIGAAVGLALPSTPQEHQLMGAARDNLLDKAQEVAQDTMQKVQQVATQAQETVVQEAEAQGLTPSSEPQ